MQHQPEMQAAAACQQGYAADVTHAADVGQHWRIRISQATAAYVIDQVKRLVVSSPTGVLAALQLVYEHGCTIFVVLTASSWVTVMLKSCYSPCNISTSALTVHRGAIAGSDLACVFD